MKKILLIAAISLILILIKAPPSFARNCTVNTDCGGGEVCNTEFGDGTNGICVPSCLTDADCLDGKKCLLVIGQTRECRLPEGGNTPAPAATPSPTGSCICSGGVTVNALGKLAAGVAGYSLESLCTQYKGNFNSGTNDSCKNLEVLMPSDETQCPKITKEEIKTKLSIPSYVSRFGSLEAVCLWRVSYTSPTGESTSSLQPGCKFDDQGIERCRLENPIGNGPDGTTEVGDLIRQIIITALGVIGAFTLLMFVWGGFQWLTSAGNPEKVSAGTQTMVWAVIGVMVVFASYVLLSTFLNVLTNG